MAVNGFKLDGENNNDYSGHSVSAAGDINGDGVADLIIGATFYLGGNIIGRSYVVFGDVPPVLVNNSLSLFAGETITISSENLAASDRNHNNETLVFIPADIAHGQFESIDTLGVMLTNFTQPQVLAAKSGLCMTEVLKALPIISLFAVQALPGQALLLRISLFLMG